MVSNPQQLLTRACLGRSNTMRQTRPDNHREERIKDSLLQKKLSLAAAAGPDRRHHPERWLYLDRARSQRTPHPSPAPPPPPSPPYQAGSPSAARSRAWRGTRAPGTAAVRASFSDLNTLDYAKKYPFVQPNLPSQKSKAAVTIPANLNSNCKSERSP